MKRFCIICGKELNIILGKPIEGGLEIISGGYYYKNLSKKIIDSNPQTIDEQNEYWECAKCYEDE